MGQPNANLLFLAPFEHSVITCQAMSLHCMTTDGPTLLHLAIALLNNVFLCKSFLSISLDQHIHCFNHMSTMVVPMWVLYSWHPQATHLIIFVIMYRKSYLQPIWA